MRTVGIVAEYNPFHNGHQYQLTEAKKRCGAQGAVAVMSGGFVQRGDIAICDKWTRATMAVAGGIDLVVELPVVYACQSAEFFARGAVALLEEIGTDYISFGAETEDVSALTQVAYLLKNPPEFYTELFHKCTAGGDSYPSARAKALAEIGYAGILDTPNNILAVEYLKAIKGTMKPVPVLRKGSQHDGYGSASYLRELLAKGGDITPFVPKSTVDLLQGAIQRGMAPITLDALESAILAVLRTIPTERLAVIRDVSEGLENRIKRAALENVTLMDTIDAVKTKRYTHSRIRRIMLNTLLGITKETETWQPQYIRVLAMNDTGRQILRDVRKKTKLPVITKTADAETSPMLELDFTATDVYALAYPAIPKRTGAYDKLISPIYMEGGKEHA